jgi:DNA ligase-1
MAEIGDGESVQVQGSGSARYTLRNTGGVYSCTCPAWAHQSLGIERRTCKHLRAYRGDDAEKARLGTAELTGKPRRPPGTEGSEGSDDDGPPLLLAHKWETDTDLTGWWLSEKLDGVRAYWDGKQFLSRLGNKFHPPRWFVEKLPAHPLDGELWGGRKLFQRTVGIVKRQDESPLWKELLYVVFDAPAHSGTFEERMAHLKGLFVDDSGSTYVRVHEHFPCEGQEHLKRELARVEALGGEGLMARKPGSKYEAGRSSTLLKVKSFHDAEARVIGHAAGAGRHKGRLGALVVELADGTKFNVGTGFSDAERASPPPVGSLITFRYQELSDGGVPRFPSYVGVRIDARAPSSVSPRSDQKGVNHMPRYELSDGSSNKFWEIRLDGTSFTTTFGRIGTEGQSSTKEWDSEEKAQKEYDKLVAEKTKKGYHLVGGRGAPKAKPAAPKPAAKPAPKAAAAPKKKAAAAAGGGARHFELVDDSSSKFWEISLDGSSFTTRFGRIGTDGQESTKEWDSDAKAQKEYDKLVAEKTKKGYVEI